jgi:hypothetical protein
MTDLKFYLEKFKTNKNTFEQLLSGLSQETYLWREREGKWNLLEVICHLHDEEREDFRDRLQSVLENPEQHFKKIDPAAWVSERNYAGQDYEGTLKKFLSERDESISWLTKLKQPAWDNAYMHPKVGPVSARFLLANWLAHDYLHLRQIVRINYHFLQFKSGQNLDYAGDW